MKKYLFILIAVSATIKGADFKPRSDAEMRQRRADIEACRRALEDNKQAIQTIRSILPTLISVSAHSSPATPAKPGTAASGDATAEKR